MLTTNKKWKVSISLPTKPGGNITKYFSALDILINEGDMALIFARLLISIFGFQRFLTRIVTLLTINFGVK